MLKVTGLAASTRNLAVHEELDSGEGNTCLIMDSFITKTCCILELKRLIALINVMMPHKRTQHK
jgi:hypothetical protein